MDIPKLKRLGVIALIGSTVIAILIHPAASVLYLGCCVAWAMSYM